MNAQRQSISVELNPGETRIFAIVAKAETRGQIRYGILEAECSGVAAFPRKNVLVPHAQLTEFLQDLENVLCEAGLLEQPQEKSQDEPKCASHETFPVKSRGKSFDEMRVNFAKAYMPWTAEDDAKLKDAFLAGKEIKILASTFERKPGAIRSRLMKLGLLSPTHSKE
jgi:hypothetical protein